MDGSDVKEKKVSTTDPESGWFHNGEHKEVFAYAVEAACDKYGWLLGYTIHPGNEHDSKTFPAIYEKIKKLKPEIVVADAGYKTPAIAKMLIDDGVTPIFPYKAPMTKKGFFRKYEYVYDEYYDCYICPNNKILEYTTTNREGYKEYKSNPANCSSCPYLSQCTQSKNHQKVGKEKMAMKIGLTFACLNMKKLAKILTKKGKKYPDFSGFFSYFRLSLGF